MNGEEVRERMKNIGMKRKKGKQGTVTSEGRKGETRSNDRTGD